jgi:hypothetical protein
MGLWLHQLYDVDELQGLDQNKQELLKNEIRKQLAYHPDIIRALATEVDKFCKCRLHGAGLGAMAFRSHFGAKTIDHLARDFLVAQPELPSSAIRAWMTEQKVDV